MVMDGQVFVIGGHEMEIGFAFLQCWLAFGLDLIVSEDAESISCGNFMRFLQITKHYFPGRAS
jgi:hypothetical protein